MSARARVIAIVSAAAVAAAGVAVGGALVQGRSTGGEVHGQTATTTGDEEREPPALELALTDRDDREARALRTAERLYETGRVEEAKERFDALLAANPNSTEAAIGAAVTAWPSGTVERLEALTRETPESAGAHLNLGLALVAGGALEEARREWREAERVDPDSPAALRADDLLHPGMPPGRPQFTFAANPPRGFSDLSYGQQLALLERRAESGGVEAWLVYGSMLERRGRTLSARRAYDRAASLAPESVEARTAAAVIRFDKDDPSTAFSRLGPLAADHPRAAIVRFHLGFALLWLPDVAAARKQLRLAVQAEPGSFYARESRRILVTLADVE
ncbi:MAG: tetratricopeptide repeat protein [Actinobacteria bacterium]|nr:tetratricopeptide repeat protein [Actinomycetota bacterium]